MCESLRQDPGPRTKRCRAAVWPGLPRGHSHLNACPLPAIQSQAVHEQKPCTVPIVGVFQSLREIQKLPEGHTERKLPGPEPTSAVPLKPPHSTPQLFVLSGFLLTDVYLPLGSVVKAFSLRA